ncbi:hypothetical protein ACLB2K_055221 [Fragaria x ananassa]
MAEAQVSVDRFSELPPEVAHHIMAFLSMADVTRVSTLSKRCRGLHLSNPTLNFDSFPSKSTLTFDKRLELLDSLDRFLIQRGNNKLKYLSIDWAPEYHHGETEIESHCVLQKSRILGWIQHAIYCNVEELYVFFATLVPALGDILLDDFIDFPFCVFVCESLRYLTLDMKCTKLEAPSFCTSPISNLVSLCLRNVTIEDDEGFCKWVSYCCRFIKELGMKQVRGLENITIESSSLESFSIQCPSYLHIDRLVISGDKLEEIDINWECDSRKRNNSLLNISAPNLMYLKWRGNMLNHQHIGEMSSLEQVEIYLGAANDVNDLHSVCEQFLCSISSVQVLLLDKQTVEVSGFDREYWELEGLEFVSKLEEVTIELTTGSNGFELASYMLEHARKLKMMFVIITPDQSSLVPEIRMTNLTPHGRVVILERAASS